MFRSILYILLSYGLGAMLLSQFVGIAQAQHRNTITAQTYLAYNETQQLSFVGRMAGSQQDVIDDCAAGMSTAELREYFSQWIEDNPGFLSREVVLAFTAAILDRCKEEKTTGKKTRLEKIEDGGWTAVPYVVGFLDIDVFNDYTFQSDDPDEEINDLFTETRLNLSAMFARELYLEIGFLLAPEGEPPPGNRTFENHGVRIDTLALTWDREQFWVSGGKGRANHGIAANTAPGIWGGDILFEAFDVNERLGFSGNFEIGNERTGHHALYAGIFTADNSFLSRPYLSDGEANSRSDGGVSNTGQLDSFVLAVDGTGIPSINGLRYHLSAVKQAVDRINDPNGDPLPTEQIGDESRIAAAVEWLGIEIGKEAALTPLIEYGRLWNARGLKDREERFLTGSLLLTIRRWNIALASTAWNIDQPADEKVDNTQIQTSGGYSFENGIRLDVGYRFLDEFGIQSHTFGIMFNYGLPLGF